MSRPVYDELVALGAPELDVDAGEFYRIKRVDLMGHYYSHEVSIRKRTWRFGSRLVPGSEVSLDIDLYLDRIGKPQGDPERLTEAYLLAWTCRRSVEGSEDWLRRTRALENTDKLRGDHP